MAQQMTCGNNFDLLFLLHTGKKTCITYYGAVTPVSSLFCVSALQLLERLFPFHAVCAPLYHLMHHHLSFQHGFQNDFEMTMKSHQLIAGIHAHRQTCMWRAQIISVICTVAVSCMLSQY